MSTDTLWIGGPRSAPAVLTLRMANRHGLIAGATGTGKTVTLQTLAEGFSRAGVPVFVSDVKGDLSGIAAPGDAAPRLAERIAALAIPDHLPGACPAALWDLHGQLGHPLRSTVSELGPLMLSHLLELAETPAGVLHAAFRIADDEGLLLLDLKDLRALLAWMGEQRKALEARYGGLSAATLAAIQRRLLVLEDQGGTQFFGEPALDLADLMRTDAAGHGVVNVLDATALMTTPRLYAMFLLWLIAELFEELPEVGDLPKPKLVFFFDEAHLLFKDAPRALLDSIEQVVRLIRSRGVGIYFVTQSPLDVPDAVLGQLGNRVQHALRAFTPRDQQAVKVAARTFRANPAFDTADVITQLGVGEALVSTLDAGGVPTPVQRVLVCPPRSRIGPLTAPERTQLRAESPLRQRYEAAVDRESAFERLRDRAAARLPEATPPASPRGAGRQRQTVLEAAITSTARAVGSSLGRQIVRGLLGSLLGGRRR